MKVQNNVTVQDQDGNSTKPLLSSRLFFRAWISSQNYMAIQGTPDLETLQSFMFHYGNEENIMQFTGLSDKNGSKIFEGDIVTYKRSVGNWTGQTMTTTHKVIFTEEVNAFVMDYGSSYIKLRKHWGYEYEIIGNIFENAELL